MPDTVTKNKLNTGIVIGSVTEQENIGGGGGGAPDAIETIDRHTSEIKEIKKYLISPEFKDFIKEEGKREVKEIGDKTESKIKNEIDSLKKEILVMFGIFASFIAFITGGISILKDTVSIYDKIGFSFIFAALMIGFLFAVMFLADTKIDNKKVSTMTLIFIIFLLLGIGTTCLGEYKKEMLFNFITKEDSLVSIASSTKPYSDFMTCIAENKKYPYQCAQSQK